MCVETNNNLIPTIWDDEDVRIFELYFEECAIKAKEHGLGIREIEMTVEILKGSLPENDEERFQDYANYLVDRCNKITGETTYMIIFKRALKEESKPEMKDRIDLLNKEKMLLFKRIAEIPLTASPIIYNNLCQSVLNHAQKKLEDVRNYKMPR